MIRIGDFEIDALISIDPQDRHEATMHPVEEGAQISDHVIERPLTVTVSGIVSDTPIGLVALQRSEDAQPSSDCYAYFRDLMVGKTLISIESGVYPEFQDMLLISLSGPKNATTGASFRFSATFQQIETATVNVDNVETLVALPRERKKANAGEQASEEEPETSQDTVGGNPKGESHAITLGKKGQKGLKFLKGLF